MRTLNLGEVQLIWHKYWGLFLALQDREKPFVFPVSVKAFVIYRSVAYYYRLLIWTERCVFSPSLSQRGKSMPI